MRVKTPLLPMVIILMIISCSGFINYSPEHIEQTSGRYLYNPDEIIDVFYKDNTLYLNWRGAENIEPLALDENTFFVERMNKKLQFVEHPETKDWYLSELTKEEEGLTYDYLKVADDYITPSMQLKNKEYNKALKGYLDIQKQDSTSVLINERAFNRHGYRLLRDEKFADAIEVFKINVALYPESSNVYDSLGDAYLRHGDSLQAYTNYQQALEIDNGNRRAKRYVDAYEKK